MNLEKIKNQLHLEGFPFIYEWNDEPNTKYEIHAHKGKTTLYILRGSIEVDISGKTFTYKEGERFDAPAGISHSAKVGSRGCTYIVGEEFEGDTQ